MSAMVSVSATPRLDWLCTEATRLLLSVGDPEVQGFLARMKHLIQGLVSDEQAAAALESNSSFRVAFAISSDDIAESQHAQRIIAARRSLKPVEDRLRFDATMALLDHAGGRVMLERLVLDRPQWDAAPLPVREAA